MIQNLNTKYYSLNPTQIQIRHIRDLQDFRIRMMSLRNDQKKIMQSDLLSACAESCLKEIWGFAQSE